MHVEQVRIRRAKARELWREYRKHQHYSAPMDYEIQRAYQHIAQGRMVIRALESIKTAGLNAQGFPKLAIVRADKPKVWLYSSADGSATMSDNQTSWSRSNEAFGRRVTFPAGSFPGIAYKWGAEAIAPLIPIHLRPKRGMANYHILWEAEWTRIIPRDPMLLRRIGKGDMWVVLAAWDLTEVERTAMAARLNG